MTLLFYVAGKNQCAEQIKSFIKISECQDGFNGYCFINSNNRIDLPITFGNDEYFIFVPDFLAIHIRGLAQGVE
jgi:hypothetical protein